MEFTPYGSTSSPSDGISLADLVRSVLMSMYQEQNPDALETDIDNARNEIEALIAEVKQRFEKTMRPINATIRLAEKQYVTSDYLTEKLADEIMQSENLEAVLRENAELRKHINTAIDELKKDAHIKPYDTLFQQAITAYKGELYDLAVLGFFAIIDGLLSDITKDRGSVKIKQRTEKAINIDPQKHPATNTSLQKLSLLMVSELLSESIPFSRLEPVTLNRHWSMHGRTRTKKHKEDCEKLILFIYGLISTAE